MAKKVVNQIKLQITAGRANPAPPIGPALGAAGVNIPMFCKEFNARTQAQAGRGSDHPDHHHGLLRPDVLLRAEDPACRGPAQEGRTHRQGFGRAQQEQGRHPLRGPGREIAKVKMPDLNTTDIEAASGSIAGTARSMGLNVIDSSNNPNPPSRPLGEGFGGPLTPAGWGVTRG